jgi:hypothetical protein
MQAWRDRYVEKHGKGERRDGEKTEDRRRAHERDEREVREEKEKIDAERDR